MNTLFKTRNASLIGFLACVALLAYAYFAQFVLGYEPCPLCIFQRIGVMAVGLVFLVATLHAPNSPAGRRVYGGLAVLAAIGGGSVSTRHIYLQNLPADQVPACGPGLDYMLDVFPLSDALRMVFTGSGECAEVDWTFLGFSMPVWTLVTFITLGAWAAFTLVLRRN
ncbi:MAG: disulfide bond formation protein B [Gammaproteobacteria bacterium]|nr:disulfide bond formation protein B [Gammaproteobacteria bacterium]